MRLTTILPLAAFLIGLFPAAESRADDWPCTVALCLANPKGPTELTECVPPIRKLFKELARGHAFPHCDMNGGGQTSGNSTRNDPTSARNCPPGYLTYHDWHSPTCQFNGVITVTLDGTPTSRVWWNEQGSITEPLSPQRAGAFDNDLRQRAEYDRLP